MQVPTNPMILRYAHVIVSPDNRKAAVLAA